MKKKLINFNFLTSLIFLGSNGGVLAMEDSGRESGAGKPAFSSPAAPEETKARKAAYEKLKSEAMTLGLPTDGGIGVLKSRIREFKSIRDSRIEESTKWIAERHQIDGSSSASYRIRTKAKEINGRGRGSPLLVLGKEGRISHAEERRQKSLEYAFKIGCSLDGGESEAQIQEAIQARKEERKNAAVLREGRSARVEERHQREERLRKEKGEAGKFFSSHFDDFLERVKLVSSADLELLEQRVLEEIEKKGGLSSSTASSTSGLVTAFGSRKKIVGISILTPSASPPLDSLSVRIKEMGRVIRGELERSVGLPRVLLLGVTGSGKTTLVHALAGKRLESRELSSGLKALEVPESDKLPGLVIGHRVTSSTLVPTSWQDRSVGLCYWDCPGFMDTRGPEQDIINAFALDQLFEAPSQIKTLLVVQASELTDSRGRDVFARFERLAKLLPVPEQLYNSTALVITKTSSRFSALDVLRSMGDHPLVRFFGDHPEKVFTFPYPEEGIAWRFEDRERLIGELQSTQVTNPRHSIDLDSASIVHLVGLYKDFGDVKDRLANLAGGMEASYRGRPLKDLQNWKRAVETLLRTDDDRLGTLDDLLYQMFTVARLPEREALKGYLDELLSSWRFNQFLMQLKEKGLIGTSLEPTHIPSVLKPYLGRLQEELTLLVANGEAIEREKKQAADLEAALERKRREAAAHEIEHKKVMEAAERRAADEKRRLQEKLDRELAQGKIAKDEALKQIEAQRREAATEKSRLESQWSSLKAEMERSHRNDMSRIEDQRRQAETALGALRRELDDVRRESARKTAKFESDAVDARSRKADEEGNRRETKRLVSLLDQAERRGDYREQERIKRNLRSLGVEFGSDGCMYLPL